MEQTLCTEGHKLCVQEKKVGIQKLFPSIRLGYNLEHGREKLAIRVY